MAVYDRCLEHLKVVTLLWPSLLAARQPGPSSVRRDSPPGIEQARELRAERFENGGAGVSAGVKEHVAPCDLTVVMTIADLELTLAVAHDQLLSSQGLPRTCSRCRHPLSVHDRSRGASCTACQLCDGFRLVRVPPDAPSWRQLLVDVRSATLIENRLATAEQLVKDTLNLIESGYLIMTACPWCHGITDAMPHGSLTLRAFIPGVAPETYVLCLNPTCDPPSSSCGYRLTGQPYWPYEELDWLSKQLDLAADQRKRLVKDVTGATDATDAMSIADEANEAV